MTDAAEEGGACSATAEMGVSEAAAIAPIGFGEVAGRNEAWLYGALGLGAGLVGGGALMALARMAAILLHLPVGWIDLWDGPLAPAAGGVFGWRLAADLAHRRAWRRYFATLAAAGAPAEAPVHFHVGDDGFHVRTERSDFRVSWPAILQLIPAPDHWLVQSDAVSLVMPRRAFAAPGEERRFIAAMLRLMNEAARRRSREAMAFAGAGAPPRVSRQAREVTKSWRRTVPQS